MRRHYGLAVSCLLVVGVARAWGVDGRIIQIGYRVGGSSDALGGVDAGAQKYREGHWVPILVELDQDEAAGMFEGTLQVVQRDRDGDLATSAVRVGVRGRRRYWLYAPPGPRRGDNPFDVQLLDADGKAATLRDTYSGAESERLRPGAAPVVVDPEQRIVLDVSRRPFGSLYAVASGAEMSPTLTLKHPLSIGRFSVADVPPHWCGLDMVDVIVWDGPDPADMTDPVRQLDAIAEWIHRGGTLVLGVAGSWQSLEKSSLGPLLPGPMAGVERTEALPEFARYLSERSVREDSAPDAGQLREPLAVCPLSRATLRPGSRVVLPDEEGADRVLVSVRRIGRGRIVFVGAELRDLYERLDPQQSRTLTMTLLDIRTQQVDEQAQMGWRTRELFGFISSRIGFETTVGRFFVVGMLFVITYILAGTLGTWQWLRSRGGVRFSWWAFAGAAIGASALGLGAVRTMRGIGRAVEGLTIVDTTAGGYDAVAAAYFGLKTSSHEDLDLWLPPDWARPDASGVTSCTLCPLPPEPGGEAEYFVTPAQYGVNAPRGRLNDVPFRATLKQFQGSWRGALTGRITASLSCVKDQNKYVLDEHAWIKNELGTDLYGCVMIQAVANPLPVISHRWGSNFIRAFKVGDPPDRGILRDGQTLGALDVMAYGSRERRVYRGLDEFQNLWAGSVGVRGAASYYGGEEREKLKIDSSMREAALMLLSTFDEFKPQTRSVFGATVLARSYLDKLDLTPLLTEDVMLLIGFSDDPGPARLCYRRAGSEGEYRALQPRSSLTVYRVWIPIKRGRS
jgi:hypothetical protein